MRKIKWFGHPTFAIIFFLLLIIEGDQFGGIYLLYLILSLPHGAPFALLAALGIAILVIGIHINPLSHGLLKYSSYFVGVGMMMISLQSFFSAGDSWQTFSWTLPIVSFVLFGIACLFVVLNASAEMVRLYRSKQRQV